MSNQIIGRSKEIERLRRIVESDRAELVAVYGRRRIGKTFLVKEFFNGKFDFYATGIFRGKRSEQLTVFCDELRRHSGMAIPVASTWIEAFMALRDYLESLNQERIVVFLDELPWFDNPKGQFLKAFEWFWNSWGSTCANLKLIVCDSATTWMTDTFIGGRGGLYNRTTERIYLAPFDLCETEQLLRSKGIDWDRIDILEAYMTFGGVPMYLSTLRPDLSIYGNIDEHFFAPHAPLSQEYDFLFRSLFKDSEYYSAIVDAIASKNIGITRAEIIAKAKVQNNGALTKALNNLIACDFIRKYNAFGKNQRDAVFQLTDLAILFFKRFVQKYNFKDEHHWSNTIDLPAHRAWTGLAFEQVCLTHIAQIKQALGIAGIQTEVSAWRFAGDDSTPGCQIDLLISRRDRVINLCEMKFSKEEYAITPAYSADLRQRVATFRYVTGTTHSLHLTMITPYGVRRNANAGVVVRQVTLDDLFVPKR